MNQIECLVTAFNFAHNEIYQSSLMEEDFYLYEQLKECCFFSLKSLNFKYNWNFFSSICSCHISNTLHIFFKNSILRCLLTNSTDEIRRPIEINYPWRNLQRKMVFYCMSIMFHGYFFIIYKCVFSNDFKCKTLQMGKMVILKRDGAVRLLVSGLFFWQDVLA